MPDQNIFYSQEFLEVLRENTKISPHTALILNNPMHAYLCEGDECRNRVNGEDKNA
jgi:uncharacterized protein YlaI